MEHLPASYAFTIMYDIRGSKCNSLMTGTYEKPSRDRQEALSELEK